MRTETAVAHLTFQRRRIEILGVLVDLVDANALTDAVARAISGGEQLLVGGHNLHSIYLFHRHEPMRQFYVASDIIHIDGMPLIAAARMRGHPAATSHRVTYVDWLPLLLGEAVARGWRLFLLGGRPGVAEQAAQRIRGISSSLIVDYLHGYFDTSTEAPENAAVLRRISEFRPHLLLVGMGMPRQERWILANRPRIAANAILAGGAAIDYLAGVAPIPPRVLGKLGLEWAYRLAHEPRRLARRYLVEPWTLFPLLLKDLMSRARRR